MSEVFKLPDGSEVATGCLMPTAEEQPLLATVAEFPESLLLDAPDIKKRLTVNSADKYLQQRKRRSKRMRNQGQLGKCNGSANASGLEQVREDQGMPDIAISDCYIYANANGGRDQGSALIATFKQLQERGASPMEVQVGGMTKQLGNDWYNRRQVDRELLAAADRDAARVQGFEFFQTTKRNFELFCKQVASAIAQDLPVIFAWHVGNASMRLRSGYAQVGRGRGNHANVLHSGKFVGGRELVHPDNQNSWGPCINPLYGRMGGNWGDGGFGLFTMEQAFACVEWHGCYIMTSVRPDPLDPALQQMQAA